MQKNFNPDWVSPTGDTIRDCLEERGWTVAEFATSMNINIDAANRLITGEAPIYSKEAVKLQSVLGGTVMFWVNREMQYRVGLQKKGIKRSLT